MKSDVVDWQTEMKLTEQPGVMSYCVYTYRELSDWIDRKQGIGELRAETNGANYVVYLFLNRYVHMLKIQRFESISSKCLHSCPHLLNSLA